MYRLSISLVILAQLGFTGRARGADRPCGQIFFRSLIERARDLEPLPLRNGMRHVERDDGIVVRLTGLYFERLHEDLAKSLSALRAGDVLMDTSAGAGVFLLSYLYGSDLRMFGSKVLRLPRVADRASAVGIRDQWPAGWREDIASARASERFEYHEAELDEYAKAHAGSASLIVDLDGPSAFLPARPFVSALAQLLKPGGKAFFLTKLPVDSILALCRGLTFEVQTVPGLTFKESVVLTRNGEALMVP